MKETHKGVFVGIAIGFCLALILISVTGCAYYPEAKDMDIIVRVHDDLTDVCGSVTAKGCAYTVGDTCFVHVGERAGYTLEHELSHCFGRRDAP